ncbi:hypothetical protein EDD11_000747 [Mortierella claussenii]|nr:hypothetical protein EDD11_000747 [Mortierella claussenii]
MDSSDFSSVACTLKIAVVGGPQYDRLYERLPLFEQETGIKVEIVYRGSHPELNDYLAATFQSSSSKVELDLVSTHIKYAPSQAHFLRELDLTQVTEQERAQFLRSALQASQTQDEKLMQLPRMVDSRVLFYRADIFEQLGLSPPKTWQDLLTIASAVRKANVPVRSSSSLSSGHSQHANEEIMEGYVFPGKLSGLFGTFYELAMMEMQHPEALFDRQDRPVFDEQVVVNVLNYMRNLVTSNAVPQDIDQYYFDEVSSLFSEGRVAMVADWPSFYGEMKTKLKKTHPEARIGVMRYPVGSNGKRSAYSGMHSFAIPKCCRYPVQALQLLKFFVRDDQQWIEASESGSFPTKKTVLQRLVEETEEKKRSATMTATAAAAATSGTVQRAGETELDSARLECLRATVENDMAMFPHLKTYPELEDALYQMIQEAMMGRVSTVEAARRMKATALASV